MIVIFNPTTQETKKFENGEQLFKYLTALENEKLLEDHEKFGKTAWSFTIISAPHVQELYTHTQEKGRCEALCEAYEQELPLLEICHGDFANPARFPLTPDTDLAALKMDWCRAYCKRHGVYLVEQ